MFSEIIIEGKHLYIKAEISEDNEIERIEVTSPNNIYSFLNEAIQATIENELEQELNK